MGVKVFFLEPTGRNRVWLRRYGHGGACASYCNAMVFLCEEARTEDAIGDTHPHDDPLWPTACEACGHPFAETDSWQRFSREIYRRADSGQEMTLPDAPAGACWNASWMIERRDSGFFVGPDGRCLVVKLPDGHEWMIDSRASNCTLPDDNAHKCWVRHGRPEDGTLHVDKNGHTCAAGAGSIATPKWHGFLHNGELTSC